MLSVDTKPQQNMRMIRKSRRAKRNTRHKFNTMLCTNWQWNVLNNIWIAVLIFRSLFILLYFFRRARSSPKQIYLRWAFLKPIERRLYSVIHFVRSRNFLSPFAIDRRTNFTIKTKNKERMYLTVYPTDTYNTQRVNQKPSKKGEKKSKEAMFVRKNGTEHTHTRHNTMNTK